MNYRKLKKKMAVTLAVGTMLSAGQAYAAEENTFQLDLVTITADRIEQTVGTTPSNVSVITAKELQDKGARTLTEALLDVPGVTIQSQGGTGQIAVPYILGSDRVVVLVDGKRMNLPQGMSYGYGGVDANTFLLADNIDRIEVVRGGASVLYGADAVGGVINIITKKGQTDTPSSVSVAAGNYGARYYSINTGGQEKNTRWLLSGTQDSNDGQRDNSAYKAKNASFRIDQDLHKGETITATYDYYGSHAGLPGSLFYPSTMDYGNILRQDWSVGYTKEHADGSRTFRYYDNNQVYSGENYGSFRHENAVHVFEYQDSAKVNTANLLTWGGEWRKDKVTSTGEGDAAHSGITKAIFLQDQYAITSSSTLTLGVRQNDSSIYGAHTLPKAAYLYKANDRTSYFANWGKIFRAPHFDELYGDDGWGDTGNPNLKPESGWTAEVGAKTKLGSVSEGTVSLFKRDLNDAIRWMVASDYTYHPQNIAHYTATGVTASVATKLSPVTTATLGYTYLDSHDQDGNSVGDPRNSFNIGLTIHDGKLTQTITGIYEDKSGTSYSQIPSHFIVNTNTVFNTTKDTSVFLTFNNLLNKQYQSVYGYPASSRTFLLGVKHSF
ncbi:MAG: cirA 6 [Firmicutes bacterium]|nr:cirA 6 [Bacillota bacterium]